MKGDAKVIAFLNEVLKAELTAINQYFLHAEMCENWKYERLAKLIRKESIEEMQHAEKLMERILYLDGTPNMSDYFKINIGATVEQQFKNDLQLEYDAVKRLNDGIQLCLEKNDGGSRELAEKILDHMASGGELDNFLGPTAEASAPEAGSAATNGAGEIEAEGARTVRAAGLFCRRRSWAPPGRPRQGAGASR